MSLRRALYSLLTIVVIAGAVPAAAADEAIRHQRQFGPPPRPLYLPGEVLVGFRAGVPASEMAAAHRRVPGDLVSQNRMLRLHRVRTPLPVEEAIRRYRENPAVAYAQPNYLAWPSLIPNDPFYDNFAGTPTDLQKWYLGPPGITAESGWDTTTGRSDVVIAIIDTGIDLNHPELASLIWINPGELPADGIDNDGNGFIDDINGWDFYTGPAYCCGNTRDNDPNPDLGDGADNDGDSNIDDAVFHGTFSAGTSCAGSNNSAEGAGAAWGCSLMALKVFTDDGGTPFSDVIDAITYAADNGAHVINMSLGTDAAESLFCPVSFPAVEAAITDAHNKGVVVVSAAGNDNNGGFVTPASCTHSMTIGASDSGSVLFGGSGDIDGRASFSNFGHSDVVAPGVDIVSPWVCSVHDVNVGFAGCLVAGGQPVGFLVGSSGTSFSTPLVAGQASLLISNALDNGVTAQPADVRACIESTALDLPDDTGDVPDAGSTWDGNGMAQVAASLADANQDGLADCLAVAGPGPNVRVDPSIVDPATGSQMTACTFVDMTPTTDLLGSYGIELSWDPAVLSYVGFTPGFGAPVVNIANTGAGLLSFAGADAAGAGGDVFVLCSEYSVVGPAGSSTSLSLGLTSLFAAVSFNDLLPNATIQNSTGIVLQSCTVGDVNGDTLINSGDALLILSDLVGIQVPATVQATLGARCGDADGQFGTDAADANVILSFEVGLPIDPLFPIGGPNATFDFCPSCGGGGVDPGSAESRVVAAPGNGIGMILALSTRHSLPGREFDLTVALDLSAIGRSLGSYHAELQWNTKLVEFVSVRGGGTKGFQSPVLNSTETANGRIRFATASPFGAPGTVELITVRLRAKRALPKPEQAFELQFGSIAAPGPHFESLLPLLERGSRE